MAHSATLDDLLPLPYILLHLFSLGIIYTLDQTYTKHFIRIHAGSDLQAEDRHIQLCPKLWTERGNNPKTVFVQ